MAAAGGAGAAHDVARATCDPRALLIGSNVKRIICEFVGPSMALAMRHFDAPIRPVVAEPVAAAAADAEGIAEHAPERLDVFIDVRHRLSALLLNDWGLVPRIWHAESLLRVLRGRALRSIDIARARVILEKSSPREHHNDGRKARLAVSDFMRLLGELHGKIHLLTPVSRALLELILLVQQHKTTQQSGFEGVSLLTSEPAFTHAWGALGLPAGDSAENTAIGGICRADDFGYEVLSPVKASTYFYNDVTNLKRVYHAVLQVPLLRAKFMPLTVGLSCPVEDLAAELTEFGGEHRMCWEVLVAKHLAQETPLVGLASLCRKCSSLRYLSRSPFWDAAGRYPLGAADEGTEGYTEVLRRCYDRSKALRMGEQPLLRWVARMCPAAFAYLPLQQQMTLHDIADYVPMHLKNAAKTRCLAARHALVQNRPAEADIIRETIVEDDATVNYGRSNGDCYEEPRYNEWDAAEILWLVEQWGPKEMTSLQGNYLLKLVFRDDYEFPFDWRRFVQQLHEDVIEDVFLDWMSRLSLRNYHSNRELRARVVTAEFLDALADLRPEDITEAMRREVTPYRRILPVKDPTKKIVFVKVPRPRKKSSAAVAVATDDAELEEVEDSSSDDDAGGAAAGGGGGGARTNKRANTGEDL